MANSGYVVTFNGTNWNTPLNIANFGLSSISCVSSKFCVTVGTQYAIIFNGTSWSSPSLIDTSPSELTSVSCVNTSFCMAVDSNGDAISYDGVNWSSPTNVSNGLYLSSVSCTSHSFCVAVDAVRGCIPSCQTGPTAGNVFIFNGSTWSPPILVDSRISIRSVSCVGTNQCYIVDEIGNVLRDNNGIWSAADNIDQNNDLNSISCININYCVAVDSNGNLLTYNGSSWSLPKSIDSPVSLNSISCVNINYCVAVDSNGNVIAYNSNTFKTLDVIRESSIFNSADSVSCASVRFCVAISSTQFSYVYAEVYNGTQWGSATNLGIPSTSIIATSLDVGNSNIYDYPGLDSVSCISDSFSDNFCAVVGGGYSVIYQFGKWNSPTLFYNGLSENFYFTSVSCASAAFCMATDLNGNYSIFNGNSWSSPTYMAMYIGPQVVNVAYVTSVSCPAVGACAAISYDGDIYYWYTNYGWVMRNSSTQNLQNLGYESISCVLNSGCNTTEIPTPYSPTTASNIGNSISCPLINACVAVGDGGTVIYNGSTWTTSNSQFGKFGLQSISCPVYNFCMAITTNGYYVILTFNQPPPPPPPLSNQIVVFVHGINGNYTKITQNNTTNFPQLITALKNDGAHVFSDPYYQDLGYSINGSVNDCLPFSPPNLNTGSLDTSSRFSSSISSNWCDSEGALAYSSSNLSMYVDNLHIEFPNKTITIIANSMGGAITRGWMQLVSTGHATDSGVSSVLFIQGAQSGSYFARIGTAPIDFACYLYKNTNIPPPQSQLSAQIQTNTLISQSQVCPIQSSAAANIIAWNMSRPSIYNLTPQSNWYNSVNPVKVPANLNYYNFTTNIDLNLQYNFTFNIYEPIVGSHSVSISQTSPSVDIGDGVMLPGSNNPNSEPFLGGENFLPGGKNKSNEHQYTFRNSVTYNVNYIVSCEVVVCSVATTTTNLISYIESIIGDPITHWNLPKNFGDKSTYVKSCSSSQQKISPVNEVINIISNPKGCK